jgi:hypothetical protein
VVLEITSVILITGKAIIKDTAELMNRGRVTPVVRVTYQAQRPARPRVAGTTIIMDNRRVMHRDKIMDSRRVMHRDKIIDRVQTEARVHIIDRVK